MATSNLPETDESDVFSLFPTSVWKVQLAPRFATGINRTVRDSLHEMNPRLPELAPGDSWQSDHQLHTLDEFRELVSRIMRSTATILKFLKIGNEEIELTGCWANVSLRDTLHLTGTHLGCEHGVCGACTVIVNGEAVRSCLMLAVQADGENVVTVEGLSDDEALTPLQAAFRKHHALQCGFCTPGMITTAHALLSEEPNADADRVREVLSGNICRCTGYVPIIEAVLAARTAYGADQ